ncbi:MAG: hypothetical protein EKK40_08220 [Bradyrhizobiaceae bacterium]|nr:MAG: hypothetical protein EKK40_08220 [Bradyrhizobiaceae bacterium]
MLDMAAYLCLFALPVVAFASRLPPYFRDPMRHTELAFAAFGLHLGNYFWSGVAKLQIGPHPWTWILENQTHKTMLYALENGTLPIGHIPWLVDHIYSTAGFLVIPLNFSIVAFQLFAIVCVFRMSWLKITSIFYDIFHAGIYILGGLFFWPWVWNNFTILLSASRQRTEVSLMAKLMCVLVILLGDVSGFPRSARLAWFDVTDVRRTYFQAVTSDGRTLAVPPSFFLTHSFGVSQGYMDMAAHEGQYRPTIWASAATYDRQLSSGTCPAPGPIDPKLVETEQKREERLDTVKHFVRAQHEKMKAREAIFGADNFYFRSHHHPSNPFLFSEFNRLNLKDVVAYNLVVESACLRLDHGKVEKTVVNRVVDRFDVE